LKIQKPELEALIQERMRSGAFQSVEDVLLQALKLAPPLGNEDSGERNNGLPVMCVELVAAMQASRGRVAYPRYPSRVVDGDYVAVLWERRFAECVQVEPFMPGSS
jgi:hypothetical protein